MKFDGPVFKFLNRCIFPGHFLAQLGLVLAGISLFALIREAFDVGASQVFDTIILWYERFLEVAIGWIGDWIFLFINFLLIPFSIKIDVQSHWKHIFVLMNVYFFRDAFFYLMPEYKSIKRFKWNFSLGFIVSLIFSTLSGLFIDNGQIFIYPLIIAVSPIFGILIYDFIERGWYVRHFSTHDAFSHLGISDIEALSFYRNKLLERGVIFIAICILVIAFWQFLFFVGKPGSALAAFVAAIFAVALYWISGRASLHYIYVGRLKKELSLSSRLLEHSGTSHLGGIMLSNFVWLGVFLISNAGLQYAGL